MENVECVCARAYLRLAYTNWMLNRNNGIHASKASTSFFFSSFSARILWMDIYFLCEVKHMTKNTHRERKTERANNKRKLLLMHTSTSFDNISEVVTSAIVGVLWHTHKKHYVNRIYFSEDSRVNVATLLIRSTVVNIYFISCKMYCIFTIIGFDLFTHYI